MKARTYPGLDHTLRDKAILDRCAELGLPLPQAERLATPSGYAPELAILWLLGLDFDSLEPLRPRAWLKMTAATCSVSYRNVISEVQLVEIFTTGQVPIEQVAHALHLLDEAPAHMVVMAAQEAAAKSGVSLTKIWHNLASLASDLGAYRRDVWQGHHK